MKKKMLSICLIMLISFIFIDIVGAETYNNYDENALSFSCGGGFLTDIPPLVPKVVSIAYIAIQIAVPIILIVMGSLDLMKGVTAQKEDEIKKGQQMFIKRIIAAVIIFFVFIIVKLLVSFVADESRVMECAECLIKNNCDR